MLTALRKPRPSTNAASCAGVFSEKRGGGSMRSLAGRASTTIRSQAGSDFGTVNTFIIPRSMPRRHTRATPDESSAGAQRCIASDGAPHGGNGSSIRARNAADVVLYDFALQLVRERIRRTLLGAPAPCALDPAANTSAYAVERVRALAARANWSDPASLGLAAAAARQR